MTDEFLDAHGIFMVKYSDMLKKLAKDEQMETKPKGDEIIDPGGGGSSIKSKGDRGSAI